MRNDSGGGRKPAVFGEPWEVWDYINVPPTGRETAMAMNEPRPCDVLQPEADDLLVFIDETGHEIFAGNQEFYGLGACAVLGAGYPRLVAKWRQVRAVVAGDSNAALHASEMKREPKNFEALRQFFLDRSLARVAVTAAKNISLPPTIPPCVPVMGQLRKEIETIASLLPCKQVRIIVESSQRADRLVRECFDQLGSLDASYLFPVERWFMPKSSNEPGLEVADFIVSAAGSQVKRRMRGDHGHAPDFNDVFCRLPALGCRYREVVRVNDHGEGVVSIDAVCLR